MNYKVEYTSQAIKSLKKFDKHVRKILKDWIEENLINTTNPRKHGKGLKGDKSGQWRYRVGDYRILAEIQDNKVVILIINIGHRKDVYKIQSLS